jgi:hypothetical protein
MDCHNQDRNNQDRKKDREQKEGTELSHLTMMLPVIAISKNLL